MKSVPVPAAALERFWVKVIKTETCWIWQARRNPQGYGRFLLGGKQRQAHRVSYEWANGPIRDGMQIDHMCHNRACVNPAHLRLVTAKQNQENRSGPQRNNTSGVRGVAWHEASGKWRVSVNHAGRTHWAGRFQELEDANAAAIAKRIELFTHNDLDRIPA